MSGLTLYHRPACHLCEQMLGAIYGTYGDEVEVTLVNIDQDPTLQARYGNRVPVLMGGGQVICEAQLDIPALDAYFHRVAGIG